MCHTEPKPTPSLPRADSHLDLGRTLIRLSGKSEQDVKIQFTGLREGEKLKEELFYEYENVVPTSCEKIKRTNGSLRDWSELCHQLDELRASMSLDGAAPIRAKIKEIVPGYRFQENPAVGKVSEAPARVPMKKAAGHA